MSPLELAKCGFIEKVGAYVFVSDIEHTCVAGSGGSHIDFMLASKSACPYVLGLFPILDVPWGTHCGLSVRLRSQGMQLITRSLMPPRKLPQVVRPSVAPQAGSKSQLAK
eukprot:8831651-Pyramimonas_sp.AAC.1